MNESFGERTDWSIVRKQENGPNGPNGPNGAIAGHIHNSSKVAHKTF